MSKSTDEALARLEHKVDQVLDLFMKVIKKPYVAEMKDGSHECPVCHVVVKYVVDIIDKSVARQCGCKTGKFAPLDLDIFAPPSAAGGKKNEQGTGNRDSVDEGDDERRKRGR